MQCWKVIYQYTLASMSANRGPVDQTELVGARLLDGPDNGDVLRKYRYGETVCMPHFQHPVDMALDCQNFPSVWGSVRAKRK